MRKSDQSFVHVQLIGNRQRVEIVHASALSAPGLR